MSMDLKRILYVEDEPDIQAVAKLALESIGGFTVEICSSGQEALDKAPSWAPQLILMDVMMPGMDGPSTLGKLREIPGLSATPVIFMTAKVQPAEILEYKALGALDVIPKPFDPMTLAASVSAVWARAHD
ncbi:MAG: response regulator [Gammaproteobacteria bacterium]|nr:response regulator [Gammaproteobacteria bacterium]MBU1731733.1 response regulator [Gammaproteobacteria bacterium]MBU1892557.1 response regulator [Gammaproteobacteria bacterium]